MCACAGKNSRSILFDKKYNYWINISKAQQLSLPESRKAMDIEKISLIISIFWVVN